MRPPRRSTLFPYTTLFRSLVLLEILAIARREAFQGGEERDQVAQQSSGLGACELEDVGIALLGKQARARTEVVSQAHEAELRDRVQHVLRHEAREVDTPERLSEQTYRHE